MSERDVCRAASDEIGGRRFSGSGCTGDNDVGQFSHHVDEVDGCQDGEHEIRRRPDSVSLPPDLNSHASLTLRCGLACLDRAHMFWEGARLRDAFETI